MHVPARNVGLGAAGIDAARRLRRQAEQRLDRRRGLERAFNSNTWPSSVSEMITAAASKYTATRPIEMKDAGKTCGARVATTL